MKTRIIAAAAMVATAYAAPAQAAGAAAYTLKLSAAAGCEVRWSDDPSNTLGGAIADTLLFGDTDGDAFLGSGDQITQSLTNGAEGADPYFKCTGPNGAQMNVKSLNGGLKHNTVAEAEGFTLLIPYTFDWTFSNAGPTSDNTGSFDSDAQTINSDSLQMTKARGGMVGSLSGTVTLDTVSAAPLIAGDYEDVMTITVDTL